MKLIMLDDAEIARRFWDSDDGLNTAAGLRLDRALPHFLTGGDDPIVTFDSDEDVAAFYAGDRYLFIKMAIMDAWPKR